MHLDLRLSIIQQFRQGGFHANTLASLAQMYTGKAEP